MNVERWDLFCRVVDNFGDIGTCWRLARQLSSEYHFKVRLWVDCLQTFAQLNASVDADAPVQLIESIEVHHWHPDFPEVEPADVVIEAFACELPACYVHAMSQRAAPPIWINLEYLSAEEWVEGCHELASPQPGSLVKKYFFFPGFTPQTGGLLRERTLLEQRAAFDAPAVSAFWQELGIVPGANDELRVSLFCYPNPSLPGLLDCWEQGTQPVRLFVTAGLATEHVSEWLGEMVSPGTTISRGSLTVHGLPFLGPEDYDRLLWACDVNFVRGEESFIRAQWAQKPFVWQIYPQDDGAHLVKLDAFLIRYLDGFPDEQAVRSIWRSWNGLGDAGSDWSEFAARRQSVRRHSKDWVGQLDRLGDLAHNLVRFVREK
ncbi:elongation factor P maturation arginine rhamnosyltransferase EarP [Schlesneria paludicola]|uniref:elongation factor P maturation arginine rhamnosyltransferase EarP n=1 Tax=Schlesneria paludicola TaxID=360056 RepID=UPI00029AFAAC|nr:elongation factor P maturation arginine rhamnosyltransferase EarP [Schlesneria paludicola]